jgi:hypothetical protein
LIGCYAAAKFRIKSAILAILMVIVVAGSAMLYTQAVAPTFKQPVALTGYYLLAFL